MDVRVGVVTNASYKDPPVFFKKKGATADTALRLSKFFGTTPNFWLGLQYDLRKEKELKSEEISSIPSFESPGIG